MRENRNYTYCLDPQAQSPAKVEIDLPALAANYIYLKKQTSSMLMPVIKADAYGHGIVPVCRTLAGAGAEQFAVGTVEEGALLRETGFGGSLLALLGALAPEDVDLAIENRVTVIAGSAEQIRRIGARANGRDVLVALKFNTGMNRLGFVPGSLGSLFALLEENPCVKPVLAVSHLASADEDGGVQATLRQIEVFKDVVRAVKLRFPEIKISLYNSAGLLAYSKEFATDYVRPGLALYGANPLFGTKFNRPEIDAALKPVMRVKAPVVQVHPLLKGESISYGGTFTAPEDMQVAIVAAGYAQGYSRGMANKSEMSLNGKRCRVLGRICMQLVAVDTSNQPEAAEGDFAYILGGEGDNPVASHELAAWWGTIPYEVFCLLGSMNARNYPR